jgi:transposase-like protein
VFLTFDILRSHLNRLSTGSRQELGLLDPESPERQELVELKRLRRENTVLREEHEFLKKATALFARLNE